MLKKLSSPRRRARPPTASPDEAKSGLDAPAAALESLVEEVAPKAATSKQKKAKETTKPSKGKKAHDPDLRDLGDAAVLTAEPNDDASKTMAAGGDKLPSPRMTISRAFRHKSLFEPSKTPDVKSPTKKISKLPKSEKKPKNADKTDDIKRHEELHSPWTQDNTAEVKHHDETHSPWTQDITATEKDPLTVTKPDAPTESTSRKKSRWKMSVPDMKHHKRTPRPPNSEKKLTLGEANEHESASAPLASSDDPAHNGSSDSTLDHNKKAKADKRKMKLSADENSTVENEREIRTNVLSPLRRPKLDPEDTFPIAAAVLRDPYLAPQRMPQLDVPPAHQPEVHLIGEIVRGHGFGSSGGLTCKWRVEYGSLWHHIAGDQLGQTQIDYPLTAPWTSDPDVAVWSHPIDLHFATSAFQGWPKLLFQVWRVDSSMASHVVGYGFVPVPFAAGQHELWVSLWRPMGSAKEEMQAQLLGRTPELTSDDVLFSAAWSERCRLRTISTGKVLVHISVLLRNFQSGVIAA